MIVFVIGKKTVDGTDKYTNTPRKDCVVHYTYDDENVEGIAVGTRWVGSYRCPPELITIGEEYEMIVANNYVVLFRPVQHAEPSKPQVSAIPENHDAPESLLQKLKRMAG